MQLIRQLSIPGKDGNFDNDPVAMAEFARYCAQDVRTMRANSRNLPDLRDEDLEVYHASERVNDRGLPIDVELCSLAVQYAAVEKVEASERARELSMGALRSVRSPKLTDWVYDRLDPALRRYMDTITVGLQGRVSGSAGDVKNAPQTGEGTGTGIVMGGRKGISRANKKAKVSKGRSLATGVRDTLLDIVEGNPSAIDPEVVEMIEAKEAGSLSSTAKFQTMLNRVSADGRLRGAFVLNGAYQTNRWTSVGAQVHNFPRLVAEDPEAILARMRRGESLPGVLKTLKSMLRPAICPGQGRVIVRADWNAVEARGLPWLADNGGARSYMEAFNDSERDIYIEQAEAAGLGRERQPGKVVVLSLGYGGGVGALGAMAKNYGVTIEQAQAVVTRWRRANGWVADKKTGWWASLGRCAMQAMRNPGRQYRAGRVVLAHLGSNLVMQLPSGRCVQYPMAEVVDGDFGPEIAYLKASWKPTADATEWPKARLWHGILAENADQAACADLLRDALVRADRQGLDVIGHVHDEMITEAPVRQSKAKGKALQRCMLDSAAWADGFPLKAEVDISPRFRK